MNHQSPIIVGSKRNDLPQHYCSCLFKLHRRNPPYRGYPYNVCTSSIYNRRGFRRGQVKCLYTRQYLESLDDKDLRNFAYAKGISENPEGLSRDDLLWVIEEWLRQEGSFTTINKRIL